MKSLYCPNCGAELPDGTKFCSKCGKSLATNVSDPDIMEKLKKNRENIAKIPDERRNIKTAIGEINEALIMMLESKQASGQKASAQPSADRE